MIMFMESTMGKTPDYKEVTRYRLENEAGATLDLCTYGACWLGLTVPDRKGRLEDVLLGYQILKDLMAAPGYMGMTIGRYGNRIGGAAFELNGKTYALAGNDGENHLHGGTKGFDKKVWKAERDGESLVFSMTSADGDEGYPGRLAVKVTYTLTEDNTVRIAYEATTTADTVVNLTNHAYFNLQGARVGGINEHEVQMYADFITEVADEAAIPTGKLMPLEGTPMNLTQPRMLSEVFALDKLYKQLIYGHGIDHNFLVRGWADDGALRPAAMVRERFTGRKMEVWTDQPAIQLYTGNFLGKSDVPGKFGVPYKHRQGFCLETQHYPDSPHHPNFPTTVLKAGETFRSVTEYRFGLMAEGE